MDPETVAALAEINRRFYEERATAFSETRERPWPGWRRVLDVSAQLRGGVGSAPLQVLDVGCGNARFASYLESEGIEFDYLGLDGSAALLGLARDRLAAGAGRRELRHVDLTRPLPSDLAERRFDLIAVFGLLHHLPGLATRRRLCRELAGLLAPGGLLALVFWRFAAFERFRQRRVAWEQHNASAARPLDPARLEPGDHLLRWGEGGDAGGPGYRYCHYADDTESDELASSLGLRSAADFLADGESGELNRYRLLTGRGVS